MEDYLSIKEAAKLLDVNSETLRRWDNSGKFKSLRHPINNYRVYTQQQINTFVNEIKIDNYGYTPKLKLYSDIEINPFVTTKNGNLYNVDAIDFLRKLESNSVDLIFADPPYNIKKADWDIFSSQNEYLEWSKEWIMEAHRVLRDNGSLYVCGFSEILADIKFITSKYFHSCKWLVWFYRNKANLGKDWGRSHESILLLRKSKKFIFNIDEARIPYNEHTVKYPQRTQAESSQYSNSKKQYVWEPNPLGAKPKDVLEIPTISNGSWERSIHPTQKPVELLKKIILSSSNKDSLIFDPFGGSGTTYAVAEAFGRKWIGTELDKNYCIEIEKRLNDKSHIDRIFLGDDDSSSQNRRKKLRGE